jgi:hypothetical protein
VIAGKKIILKDVTVPMSLVPEKAFAANALFIIKIWVNCRLVISAPKMKKPMTGQLISL